MELLEAVGFKGQLDAAIFDMRSLAAETLEARIEGYISARRFILDSGAVLSEREQDLLRADYLSLRGRLDRFKKREMRVTNLVTTVGRSAIAQRLANTTTCTGIINYGA